MSIECNLDREKNLTVFKYSGQVTLSEITKSLEAYGKAGPTTYELYDLCGLDGERLSNADIDRLVDYLNRFGRYRPDNSKTAVVVEEDLDFGISKTVALLTAIDGVVPYQINVFRGMDEAIRWLDLETEKDDQTTVT